METLDGQPTDSNVDATPLARIEALLSAGDEQNQSEPQNEDVKADAPEAEEPKESDVDDAEGETPEYQLADVAEMLGTDASQLDVDESGKIVVKTKIEGVEGRVKLTDLIKDHQLKGYAEKTVREAAEIRKSAMEQAQAVQQQLEVQQAVIGKIAEIKAVEAEYQQYRSINLDQLIDHDPVQALKVQRHMQALQERHAALSNEANQAANFVQQQRVQQSTAVLQQEAQALMRAIPEWSDTSKAEAERNAIKQDLKARGYTDRDIDSLSDHKAVLLARDAMLYRQMKAGNTAAEKQVRAAPKIVKPGSSGQPNRADKNIRELKTQVRQTGSKQSVMDYLIATGKV